MATSSLVDRRWESVVRPLLIDLASVLDPDSFLHQLFRKRLITKEEYHRLHSMTSRKEKSLALLSDILPRKGPKSYDDFVSVLRATEGQEHVFAVLGGEREISTKSVFEKAVIESPFSHSFQVRGMTLKFAKAQTVLKCVGQSGDTIESEFFSLIIPPGAVVGSAINVGFTVYEYQSEESESVEDDTDITDLLFLHPCGEEFAENVTITMRLLPRFEQKQAFLFYKAPHSVSFSSTCVGVNPTEVHGGTGMSAVLHESYLEITTQHFCRFFAGMFHCFGHKYYVLAFGRWTSGQNFPHLTKAVVDIRFTSSRMRFINELKARYKHLPLLLDQSVTIYFKDPVSLQCKNVSSGWRLHSNKVMRIEKRSLQQARRSVIKHHTESLTLEKRKEEASDQIWLEVRLMCGRRRRSILLTLQEYSLDRLQELPQEVTTVVDSEILGRKPTGRELNKLSKELTSWKPVARCLLVPEPNISEIERKYANDPREQVYQALLQWVQRESESASVKALCRALRDEGQTAIAAEVFELSDEVLRDRSF
ncbi:uncharacterized protein [Oscarella lobularis]|uniref:uncharacterized protein isoform X2 n=1 Tax=Oscarella lobularis TaxID=121494 RepID=UPI00331428CC